MGIVMVSIFTIIFSVEFMMGNLGNGLIILVNCVDLVERRKLSAADRMLTALAVSRMGLLWLMFISWWTHMFYPAFWMIVQAVRVTYVTWTLTCHFNTWLASCLSIFYCLKIANFSNSIFLYLKWRVKKVVSVTLLGSLVLLFLNLFQSNTHLDVWFGECKRNTSYNCSLHDFAEFSRVLIFTNSMFTLIPFAVSLTTFLLLIFSLWRHLKRMQHSAGGHRDASTTAHTKALGTLVAFLLLYTVFFISLLVEAHRSEFLFSYVCQTVLIVFPSLHSFVLVLGNNKLRQASVLLLRRLRCGSKDVESSAP